VLLITQDLQRAGAQRQCVELAIGLAASGWRVDVATVEPGGALAGEIAAAGLPLNVCARRWRWDLSPARSIADLIRRGSHDVAHSFLFLPNFYARLAGLMHRPPVLVSSLRSTGIEGRLRYLAEVLMAPLCDVIIANSDAGKADLVTRGVSPRRVVVVRNGLDLARFAAAPPPGPAADGSRLIGMVAQMESRKDHAGLVEAFGTVLRRYPRARLILAGDGSLRPAIEERVHRLGLENQVAFPGTVERPETVHASLEIYVQASASEEGTSNSILEAMASGRPVVATDIGGNREVVRHGETGLIVPPRDPGALAAALAGLLDEPRRARRMGAAGAALARARFSRDAMVRATVDVYSTLLEARERRTGGRP
jgi:glycosyltransferase involved in cell wall biosynthesis